MVAASGCEPYVGWAGNWHLSKIDLLALGLNYYAHDLSVSEDGVSAALSAFDGREPACDPAGELVLLDLMAGQAQVVDRGRWIHTLAVSSYGGRSVLYLKEDEAGQALYLYSGARDAIIKVSTSSLYAGLSPDTSTVAYITSDGLHVYDVGSAAERQLVVGRGMSHPVWYPDGGSLLYFRNLDAAAPSGSGSLQRLEKVSLRSGETVVLAPEVPGELHRVGWVALGESIHIRADEGGRPRDYVLHLDMGTQLDAGTRIGRQFSVVSFSADGARMAFLSAGERSGRQDLGRSRVWVVDADGGQAQCLTRKAALYSTPLWAGRGAMVVTVQWSQDGSAFKVLIARRLPEPGQRRSPLWERMR